MFAGHEDDSLLSWFDHLSQKMQEETSLALLTDTEEGQLQCQEDNESRARAKDIAKRVCSSRCDSTTLDNEQGAT